MAALEDDLDDPVMARLRQRRRLLGLTLRSLAGAAGIGSAAFVLSIENGDKVPSDAVARRLARALGEDEELVAAWALARRRASLRAVLAAARTMLLDDELRAHARGEWRPDPRRDAPAVRLRVPLHPWGADPDAASAPLGYVRVAVSVTDRPEAWLRPFAYRLARATSAATERALVMTRAVEHLDPHRRHVVRTGGGIVVGHSHWNGAQLVVFHGEPGSFVVVPAAGPGALAACMIGVV